MPRRRPPHVLRCRCGYSTLRVAGRPPLECPRCAARLRPYRISRDEAERLKAERLKAAR